MWTYKEEKKTFPDPLVSYVESDVQEFVEQELVIYKQNRDNKRIDNSVIFNLAMFNPQALSYQNGYDQMVNLLDDKHTQFVGSRLRQLLHTLYIRYGVNAIDDLAEHTLKTMVAVYKVPDRVVAELDEKFNVFWLQPFIRLGYTNITNSVTTDVEKETE